MMRTAIAMLALVSAVFAIPAPTQLEAAEARAVDAYTPAPVGVPKPEATVPPTCIYVNGQYVCPCIYSKGVYNC
jgi:hypothetical protein